MESQSRCGDARAIPLAPLSLVLFRMNQRDDQSETSREIMLTPVDLARAARYLHKRSARSTTRTLTAGLRGYPLCPAALARPYGTRGQTAARQRPDSGRQIGTRCEPKQFKRYEYQYEYEWVWRA